MRTKISIDYKMLQSFTGTATYLSQVTLQYDNDDKHY